MDKKKGGQNNLLFYGNIETGQAENPTLLLIC
jgi:hypothetical protein